MSQATMAECPKCGAKVRKEKLRRHVNAVHGAGAAPKSPAKVAPPKATVTFPWTAVAVLAVVGALVVAGYWFVAQSGGGGGGGGSTTQLPVAVIVVKGYGTFEIELDTVRAPRTAGNFISLAKSGFYNGLTFHRIVQDFVVQGGDPNGDGTGGSGTEIPFERTNLKNLAHTVAMARGSSPDSATSQFYINLVDNPSLDAEPYPYVVFGKVVGGHDVVTALGNVPTGANDRPLTPVVMTSVTIRNG